MNYREVKDNIRDLGFSDDAEIEEFGSIISTSVNRAITEISLSIPIYGTYEFEIADADEGIMYIHMPAVANDFIDFRDVPVLYEKNGNGMYVRFADYEIETSDTLVIDCEKNKGRFRIFYIAEHPKFTADSLDEEEILLPKKAQHLLPLLASYYVWLEDEPAKAAQYYNLYESRLNDVLANTVKPRAKILTGGI